MLDSVVGRNNLIASIEKARNSTLIAYMLHDNAVIADDALPQIYDKLQGKHRERIDFMLYTRGGVTEVCWRLLGMLREHCDHLAVFLSPRVQGAGSLIALGADELVMGPLSELGSVEAIRNHPLAPRNELGQVIPVSLGEIKSLMSFIGEQTATADAAHAGVSDQLLASLFPYIHPLAIAHLQQADMLSRDVTRKALRMHMQDEVGIERLVDLFNGGFHSPVYTAGRAELRDAGLPVTYASEELWNRVWELTQLYQATLYNERPDPAAPGAFYRYVCLVETSGRTTGLRQAFTQADGQERVLQVRWETAVKGPGPGPSFGPGNVSNN